MCAYSENIRLVSVVEICCNNDKAREGRVKEFEFVNQAKLVDFRWCARQRNCCALCSAVGRGQDVRSVCQSVGTRRVEFAGKPWDVGILAVLSPRCICCITLN